MELHGYRIRKILPRDNKTMARLVRSNLKAHGLDIPGTVYFDPCVDDLCAAYSQGENQGYYVLVDADDTVMGGIGFEETPIFSHCAELQKLYLADAVKGNGFGYALVAFIEERMKDAGFSVSYLETHHNLQVAIHLYEKCGYVEIERPPAVAHGAMDRFYYKPLQK